MVCEPKDHVYSLDPKKNKLGGYLLNDVHYTTSLIKDKIGYEKNTVLDEDNIIVSLINGLSKTPYKINIDTLEYIFKFGLEKKIIIDDSNDELESFRKNPFNKKYSEKDSLKFRSIISKILMQRNILNIAETYSKVYSIYFPVRMDQRTRIYCVTDFFDYQKSDLAKGLISFVRPGHITKYDSEYIKYFKAYGANMYGHSLDKKSLNYRVKWVDENRSKILNFYSNDIVDNAESKACFISFCFEYKRFIEFMNNIDNIVFYTYLPIQLDATCNGYQHLALLTHEIGLLSKLNLGVSTHNDDPNDYYSYIADITKDHMDSLIKEMPKEIDDTIKNIKELNIKLKKSKLHVIKYIYDKIFEVDNLINEIYNSINKENKLLDKKLKTFLKDFSVRLN